MCIIYSWADRAWKGLFGYTCFYLFLSRAAQRWRVNNLISWFLENTYFCDFGLCRHLWMITSIQVTVRWGSGTAAKTGPPAELAPAPCRLTLVTVKKKMTSCKCISGQTVVQNGYCADWVWVKAARPVKQLSHLWGIYCLSDYHSNSGLSSHETWRGQQAPANV